jgi:hypothetical protein
MVLAQLCGFVFVLSVATVWNFGFEWKMDGPLHIYAGTNMNTDLDWIYYRNSVFIIILKAQLLNIDMD